MFAACDRENVRCSLGHTDVLMRDKLINYNHRGHWALKIFRMITRPKIVSLVCLFLLMSVEAFAQTQTFDMVTYTPPKGWSATKGADQAQFSKEDKTSGGVALITVYRSVDAGTDPRANFNTAWEALVNDTLKTNAKPENADREMKGGWAVEGGIATINSADFQGVALLFTATGGSKMVNVLILTNTDAFQKDIEGFIDSVKLLPIKAAAQKSPAAPARSTPLPAEASRLIGKWNRSSSGFTSYADPASWGTAGYTKSRYEFRPDGTYEYTERSFRMMMPTIIIVRENGRYSVGSNTLTITPQQSTISSYKKAGGADVLGELVKTQARPLEAVTYRFYFHYFEGIREWNLVLQADKPTLRDGPFSTNQTYPNAWYFDQKYTNTDLTAPRN